MPYSQIKDILDNKLSCLEWNNYLKMRRHLICIFRYIFKIILRYLHRFFQSAFYITFLLISTFDLQDRLFAIREETTEVSLSRRMERCFILICLPYWWSFSTFNQSSYYLASCCAIYCVSVRQPIDRRRWLKLCINPSILNDKY